MNQVSAVWLFTSLVLLPVHLVAQPTTNALNARDPLTADAAVCASMQGTQFGAATIVASTLARPPYHVLWMNSGTRDDPVVHVPFCRLEATANPVPRSHIGIEIWLPIRAQWNGRFLGVGAGGSMGDVNRPLLADGVNRGFAAAATDNGHRSPSYIDRNEWALGEPERIADFGYRAHHVATVAGKAAAHAYYGKLPAFSYMAGSSQGGQKAMLAAQRYPDDYDGILAVAPVYSWVNEMTQQAWSVRALTATPQSAINVAQMQALQDAARAQCGAPNGLIMDPSRCDFDPARLKCPAQNGRVCFSDEQITAVLKLYAGPRRSDGRPIFPGFSPGGERGWSQFYGQVSADGTKGGGSWLGVYRYMVFDDPTWTLDRLDFDRDPDYAKTKIGTLLDPDSPDLDRFASRGGKLIVIHGWADQQVPALSSVEYHRAVVMRSSARRVDQYFRLFMVPGMSHSLPEIVASTSPLPTGPNVVPTTVYDTSKPLTPTNDALTALQRWVEQGVSPSHFDVRVVHEQAGITARMVRACAAPRVAAYLGNGDPMRSENWSCKAAATGS